MNSSLKPEARTSLKPEARKNDLGIVDFAMAPVNAPKWLATTKKPIRRATNTSAAVRRERRK